VLACLQDDEAVRRNLPAGGRIHIDRPLPFLCVHAWDGETESAALEIATANASYLIAPGLAAVSSIVNAVGRAMLRRHGAFLVVEVGELERDRLLPANSPYLPPFEILLSHGAGQSESAAAGAFTRAVEDVEVKYRSPQVEACLLQDAEGDWFGGLDPDFARLRVEFAPIYRQPESERVYPDLRQRVVAGIFDAILQAIAALLAQVGRLQVASHRALGRRLFVEAVRRLDERIDEVANSFDFLLAVTPINADIAWQDFRASGFRRAPRLLYRPLALEIDDEKRRLHSISFDNLEDPLLTLLYREKQQELDLQLTLLELRDTSRFREASRVLYGPVGSELLRIAEEILLPTAGLGDLTGEGAPEGSVDCAELSAMARGMIEDYRTKGAAFDASVEVRDDIPAGMMVSGPRLLIGRSTVMARRRVEALLSHEVGVHLYTYFSGDLQGLRVFRSGLAGYEGVQEGLAVFAEYLVGGLTLGRLRLIAARVVGCATMLDGADFVETFRLLHRDRGFPAAGAFGIALRLHRSGGLAKDAIYLRGLLEVLDLLRRKGSLDPLLIGKFSTEHLPIMQELAARGLLRSPPVPPAFLSHPEAAQRLEAARAGISPLALAAG
jgi:uncharacterized protein (TIGR02421 family)